MTLLVLMNRITQQGFVVGVDDFFFADVSAYWRIMPVN